MGTIPKLPTAGKKKQTTPQERTATFAALKWIAELEVTHKHKVLLYALLHFADGDTLDKAFPKTETLAAAAGFTYLPSVRRLLRELQSWGMLSIQPRYKEESKQDGSKPKQTSNLYRLLMPTKYWFEAGLKPSMGAVPHTPYAGGATAGVGGGASAPYLLNVSSQGTISVLTENLQEEIGEQYDCPQANPPGHGDSQAGEMVINSLPGEVTPEEKDYPDYDECNHYPEDEKSSALLYPVTENFKYGKSVDAAVGHWWALMATYRPENYMEGKDLTPKQFEALKEVYRRIGGVQERTRTLLEHVVSRWDVIRKLATHNREVTPPPLNPTTTWVNNNLEFCIDHLHSTTATRLRGFGK